MQCSHADLLADVCELSELPNGSSKHGDVFEAFLRTQPDQRAVWHGWAGAHKLLVADGLVSARAPGMRLAQEAIEDLERNGKIDICVRSPKAAVGTFHLQRSPKWREDVVEGVLVGVVEPKCPKALRILLDL